MAITKLPKLAGGSVFTSKKAMALAHPDPKCRFRLAAQGAVAIECPHGYDCCPECDPCTCRAEYKKKK